VKLICIKENIRLNGDGKKDLQSTVLISMFSLLAEIEHTLISERTKAGMKAAKAKGVTLGRPKGIGTSKLDKHKDKIVSELKLGVPKTRIAKRYGSSLPNFHHWLKTREIKVREVDHE
jgi:DNA invertase Pin-like site-specific DNA recombinase